MFLNSALRKEGKACWRKCRRKQGPCETGYCGTEDVCCKKDHWDKSNGCDGTIGGISRHECTAPGTIRIKFNILGRFCNEFQIANNTKK